MSTAEKEPTLWERVKDRPGALGADREAALAHARGLSRAPVVRTRDEAASFLNAVGDAEARELMLFMVLSESNYALTERLVALLGAAGDASDAAKALHVAEAHAAKASAFAFRRIARAIGERLAQPEAQLKAALAPPDLTLFQGRLATAEREAAPTKSSGAYAAPALAAVPPPAAKSRAATWAAPVALVLLVLGAAGVALWPRLSEIADQAGDRTLTIAPQALASSASPAAFTHAKVNWSGVIENVVALTRTLYIKTGDGAHVIAVFDASLPDVRIGDAVKFSGRVNGRSRFGPIHLRGLSVERSR